jgi:Prokaryotic homologs of the JAB domain
MVITDLVYSEIRTLLASHAPERGGALYGSKGYPFVTHFEFDQEGETSSVSYVPSTRLIANVPKVEAETGLQFKGIIHSHPLGYTHPSGGDEQTVASFFRLNPHFSAMALPIVQQVNSRGLESQSEFLHWYRAERRGEQTVRAAGRKLLSSLSLSCAKPVEVLPEEFHIVPIAEHVKKILTHLQTGGLTLTATSQVQPLKVLNAELIGLVATSQQGHEFLYFVSLDYPIVAPVVLFQSELKTKTLCFSWDGMSAVESSLFEIGEALMFEWQQSKPLSPRFTGANQSTKLM